MTYQVFDTTLRDGAQREGITYSVADKLAVARLLDEFGVGFIEGGWPGAMPKDTEFFRRARTELTCSTPCWSRSAPPARPASTSADDPQVRALLDAETAGGLPGRQVRRAPRRAGAAHHAGEENLAMVRDTVAYFVRARAAGSSSTASTSSTASGSTRRTPPRWSRTALEAGAEVAVMCDTNGGMLPSMVTRAAIAEAGRPSVDRDEAPTGSASTARTTPPARSPTRSPRSRPACAHFQCTANGYGERPGNADLFATVANLQLKLGLPVLPEGCLEQMVRVSHAIAEIANLAPDTHQAYVGAAAFAHKAGLHASAIKVDPLLYNHIDPPVVGNDMRILVTEMAGRASIELKSRELGLDLAGHPDALSQVTQPGQGAGGAAAGRSRPPTPRSSCWSARELPGRHRSRRSRWSRTG